MITAACIANKVGYELLSFLISQQPKLQYVVTYKGDKYEDAISVLCKEHGIPCYRDLDVNSDRFIRMNRNLGVDIVFLLWWPVIIKKATIDSVKRGFINLHPSFLPFNRGMNPYYWSIVDGTPAGVTIHWIDEEIDRGEILFQKRLDVPITETGEGLYKRAVDAMIQLFRNNYSKMLDPNLKTRISGFVNNRVHRVQEMIEHSHIDLNRIYRAGELINILRARTFSDGESAYFYQSGKKYYIRVSIEEVGEAEPQETNREESESKKLDYADSKA